MVSIFVNEVRLITEVILQEVNQTSNHSTSFQLSWSYILAVFVKHKLLGFTIYFAQLPSLLFSVIVFVYKTFYFSKRWQTMTYCLINSGIRMYSSDCIG